MPSDQNSKVFGRLSMITGIVSFLPQGIALVMSVLLIPASVIGGVGIPEAFREFFASGLMTAALIGGIVLGLAAAAFGAAGLIRREKKVLPIIGLVLGTLGFLISLTELVTAYI